MLKFMEENGIIDITRIQEMIEMQKKQELLSNHPYKIWQGSDNKWHTYLPDEVKGRVPRKRNTKEEIEDVVVNYWKEKQEKPLVKEIFYEWLTDKLNYNEIEKSTYDRYEVDFNKYFVDIMNKRVEDIEPDFLEEFVKNSISKYDMTSKCYSNFRTLLYGIFKRAKKKKIITFSITQLVQDMEVSKKAFKKVIKLADEQVYSSTEKTLMEAYLEKNQDIINLGLLLMFKTGFRIGELSTIEKDLIENYCIPITNTETRYKDSNGKACYEVKDLPKSDAGIRYGIIPDKYKWILDRILELNPDGKYLFEKDGHRVKTYSFRRRLRYICESKICIKPKSPHKVRKTFGTILIDANAKESTILETMGHADIQVTKNHYYFGRAGVEDKRSELNAIAEL